jgi:hypothetical protein
VSPRAAAAAGLATVAACQATIAAGVARIWQAGVDPVTGRTAISEGRLRPAKQALQRRFHDLLDDTEATQHGRMLGSCAPGAWAIPARLDGSGAGLGNFRDFGSLGGAQLGAALGVGGRDGLVPADATEEEAM